MIWATAQTTKCPNKLDLRIDHNDKGGSHLGKQHLHPKQKRLKPIHPWWGGILGRRSLHWFTHDIFPWVYNMARFRAYHYYFLAYSLWQAPPAKHGSPRVTREIHLGWFPGSKVCFHYMVPPQNVTQNERVEVRCTKKIDPASYVVCEKASGWL